MIFSSLSFVRILPPILRLGLGLFRSCFTFLPFCFWYIIKRGFSIFLCYLFVYLNYEFGEDSKKLFTIFLVYFRTGSAVYSSRMATVSCLYILSLLVSRYLTFDPKTLCFSMFSVILLLRLTFFLKSKILESEFELFYLSFEFILLFFLLCYERR